MKKYNLFIVGFAKCGSSFLYNLLGKFPDISFSSLKEPNFFGSNSYLSSEEYHSLIDQSSEFKFFGDATVEYILDASSLMRIKEYNNKAKIIIVMRDPVQRAWSHYWHRVKSGEETRHLDQILKLEEEVFSQQYFIRYSEFAKGILNVISVFDDNYKIVYLDRLKSDEFQKETIKEVLTFIEFTVDKPELSLDIDFTKVDKNESSMYRSKFIARAHFLLQQNKNAIIKVIPFMEKGVLRKISGKLRTLNRKKWKYPEMSDEFEHRVIHSLQKDFSLYKECGISSHLKNISMQRINPNE